MRNFLAIATLTLLLHLTLAEDREKRSTHGYGYDHYEYKKGIYCYQCAYSPPKTYYKTIKEYTKYGHSGDYGHGHGHGHGHDDYGSQGSYGKHGGYVKEYKVPYTVYGGWDKCLKPFDHYDAKKYGIDVWECHGNCYIRKEKNGNVFRGCYKGEYKVDPYKLGCHWQQGALWCFCKGDKCNNGAVPYH